jgi:hypothetical protein
VAVMVAAEEAVAPQSARTLSGSRSLRRRRHLLTTALHSDGQALAARPLALWEAGRALPPTAATPPS